MFLIFLPICLSSCLTFCLSICLSSLSLPLYLSVLPSVYLPVCLSSLSVYLSIRLSICLSSLSVYLSICLSFVFVSVFMVKIYKWNNEEKQNSRICVVSYFSFRCFLYIKYLRSGPSPTSSLYFLLSLFLPLSPPQYFYRISDESPRPLHVEFYWQHVASNCQVRTYRSIQ